MEAELLTTFQKVAIVDEVTVIKDMPLVVWIRTPRFGLATPKLLCWLVLGFDLGVSTCSMEVTTGSQHIAGTPVAKADQEKNEKLRIVKAKSEENIRAMPMVLKRIGESIAKIEKLEHLDVNIHPVFKTKR
uniref:Uncharacterized protein n=1 Tax=Oryza punctata TaxID=4537 RepID=A0A0E0KTS7_ORYPU